MRKAIKRQLGEERNRVYMEQEAQRQKENLRLANQIRAEKAQRKLDDAKRKGNRAKAGKVMRQMARQEETA